MSSDTISILISSIAAIVAILAAIFTGATYYDQHRLSQLEHDPYIILDTFFNKKRNGNYQISIRNIGPVDAVLVSSQEVTWSYNPDKNIISGQAGTSWGRKEVDHIRRYETYTYSIDSATYEVNRGGNTIFEIRISYRRPQDLKAYMKSAFYMRDENGKIRVLKYLEGDRYDQIRQCLDEYYSNNIKNQFLIESLKLSNELTHSGE